MSDGRRRRAARRRARDASRSRSTASTRQRPEGHQRARGRATPLGIDISYFCYHPGLSSPAVCRQCLVDVEGQPKLVPTCYTPVADKHGRASPTVAAGVDVARSRCSSSRCSTTRSTARSATRPASARCRSSTSTGTPSSRATTAARCTSPRSSTSGRTSCSTPSAASCARAASASATRSRRQHQLEMAHRGDHEVLTTAPGQQLDNPYSLNTVDVCPVGALTAKDFRFTMRAWELVRDAVGVHRLRHRLQHRGPPRAAARSGASCRAHNPDGQQVLDVRRGPLHLQGASTSERLAAPRVDGVARRLGPRARRAAQAAARARSTPTPATVGVVLLGAGHQRGQLRCSARLAIEHLGVGKVYLAGARQGWRDDILLSADVNPNTAGAIAIGAGRLQAR